MSPLAAAVKKANKTPGADTILLKAGCTYTLTAGPYDNGSGPNGLPIVAAPLTIHGNGATITRNPAAPVFRFFQIESTFALDHVTLSNGRTSGQDLPAGAGGAILAFGGSLTIADSTFTGNAATVAGGAIQAFTPLSLTRDTFQGNSVTLPQQGSRAVGGGAVSAGSNSPSALVILQSKFAGNWTASSYGGAVAYGGGGTVTIGRSTFTSNSAIGPAVGNAFWIGGADSVTVSDSTFTLNYGGGGAIGWEGGGPDDHGTVTVTGSTFDRNPGRGLQILAGPDVLVVVANSTFFDSEIGLFGMEATYDPALHMTNSTLWGSGISNGFLPGWQGTVTLRNTIVAGGNCGPVADGGGNLAYLSPGCPGVTGDPKLRPLAWNVGPTQTMAFDPGSAAIGGATWTTCQAPIGFPLFGAGGVDQRGVLRQYPCDIGAYERS